MKLLATPAWTAAMAALLALSIHPALGLTSQLPVAAPALALLWLAGLLSQAPASRARTLFAFGALITVTALGFDALRGASGTVELAEGETATRLSERDPAGRETGLRPLGFSLKLDAVDGEGALALTARDATRSSALRVTPSRAATFGRLRFGRPEWKGRGPVALRLAITRAGATEEVLVSEGAPAAVSDLQVDIEQYFPDFALDANRQPYTRSAEPRNPAALLRVTRGGATFRVFVLKALPGIHKQEGLDASFALLDLETTRAVELAVSSEPAAPAVAAGVVLLIASLVLGARAAVAPGPFPAAAGSALGLAAVLASLDAGRLLRWRFGADTSAGRVELPGVGLPLGLALLAALAAFLLLSLATQGEGRPAGRHGRSALVLGTGLAAIGVGSALLRVQTALVPSLVALATAVAFAGLGASRLIAPQGGAGRALDSLYRAAPLALTLSLFVTGGLAWSRAGSYDAPRAAAAASAALLALAAAEAPRGSRLLGGFAVAAVAWLVAS